MFKPKTRKIFARVFAALLLVLAALVAVGLYHSYKPLPDGLSYRGQPRPAEDVEFLADLTYVRSASGEPEDRQFQQEIFDEVLAMVGAAEQFILLDMFLFNDFQGALAKTHRALSAELADALIAQKKARPQMQIVLITDPVNRLYGGMQSPHMSRLAEAGIAVTYTDLSKLRDSNLLYSPIYRTFFSYWGNDVGGLLPNPMTEGRVSLRTYLRLLNFKANHRKLIIADEGDRYFALVTSGNPHDGSSAHGNVALKFSGPAVADLLATEKAVLEMSGGPQPEVELAPGDMAAEANGGGTLEVLTERAIEHALLETIAATGKGDSLDVAVFYLADRHIMQALKAAQRRGVSMRVLLDPSKDAFGRTKNGIPNRQTAHALHSLGVPIRWCDTHGEQCHSKLLLAGFADGSAHLILGSANFTRRNLDDLNLETSVRYIGSRQSAAIVDAADWFEMRWTNTGGRQFSVDYATYADENLWRRGLYRVMETLGANTF